MSFVKAFDEAMKEKYELVLVSVSFCLLVSAHTGVGELSLAWLGKVKSA